MTPQEKFRLPRSSYEELCKIIRAYGRLEKPASLAEVTQVSGIGKTLVSSNNTFLKAVEIIEGGMKKNATDKGRELARALEHDLPEQITKVWREVIEDSDFLSRMVAAVRIRKGMDISSLETHIAFSAGEPKSKSAMTGARTVIDIFRISDLVKEEDDKIVPAEELVRAPQEKPVVSAEETAAVDVPTPPGVSLRIDVRIDAKPSELEGLGEKLKSLIESLSKGSLERDKTSGNDENKG